MPIRKLKPVEAGDGSYGGKVLEAFDRLPQSYATTGAALAGALARLSPRAPTVADLDHWERTLSDRPYPGIATKMEACFLIKPSTSIDEAKRYLTLTRDRLSRSAKLRPERFDPNRLFCAKAMLSLIERYERYAASRADRLVQARAEGVL